MLPHLSANQLLALETASASHYWPHMRQPGGFDDATGLKPIVSGQGVWLVDSQGRRYFDTLAGLWLNTLGHGRTEIATAVSKQLMSVAFTPASCVAPETLRLAERLAQLAPLDRGRVFFVTGGTEANETAVKMVRKFHRLRGEPTRTRVISRSGSYHGSSMYCMTLGESAMINPRDYGALPSGNTLVGQPGRALCSLCQGSSACTLACAASLERAILETSPHTVAAFIAEPISAAAGLHEPGIEYWSEIQRICRKYGVLLILDEVITAFGRTGAMFGAEHYGIRPDIVTVSKGITGGYIPLGAAIASGEVADEFRGGDERTFRHISTFGNNAVSSAAAMATLDVIQTEGLLENSRRMGRRLVDGLRASLGQHRLVGSIRGDHGLLCAIDIVQDKTTGARFPPNFNIRGKLSLHFRNNGLLARVGDVVPLAPPLVVTAAEVDELVSRVKAAIDDLEREPN